MWDNPDDHKKGISTVVWLSPLIFPVIMATYFLLFIIFGGISEGLRRFLGLALDMTVTLSVYFFVLLLLLPVLRRFFSARACATLWLLPVFLLYITHIPAQFSFVPKVTIYIPQALLDAFLVIWAAGFAAVFLWKLFSHFRFKHHIMTGAELITDESILAVWSEECSAVNYKQPVKLYYSKTLSAPLSMGMTKKRRITVLPQKSYSESELHLIFRHEIRHLQRSDVDTKVFLAFCTALCWFNPLVWAAVKKASDDLELSCDEMVLCKSDDEERKQYAYLLLKTAGNSRGFSTCLSSAAGSLRYRLKNVISVRRRFAGTVLLAAAMFIFTMCYGFAAVTTERGAVSETVYEGKEYLNVSAAFLYEDEYYSTRSSLHDDEDVLEDKLFNYISELQVEALNSLNEPVDDTYPKLDLFTMTTEGRVDFTLSGSLLEIWHANDLSTKFYIVKSDIDWDYICSCFVKE